MAVSVKLNLAVSLEISDWCERNMMNKYHLHYILPPYSQWEIGTNLVLWAPLRHLHLELFSVEYLCIGCSEDLRHSLLVMVDKFSKFASTAITKNQTAATTVKAARSKVIQTFGDRCQTKVQTLNLN